MFSWTRRRPFSLSLSFFMMFHRTNLDSLRNVPAPRPPPGALPPRPMSSWTSSPSTSRAGTSTRPAGASPGVRSWNASGGGGDSSASEVRYSSKPMFWLSPPRACRRCWRYWGGIAARVRSSVALARWVLGALCLYIVVSENPFSYVKMWPFSVVFWLENFDLKNKNSIQIN